jgi:soluble lytic murein transglycosylase-like protein
MDPTLPAVSREVLAYAGLAAAAGAKYGVDPALVLAVIHEESGGDPDAFRVEPAVDDASFGLMQLLVRTARGLGFAGPLHLLFDPATNIALGTQALAGGIKAYGSMWLALIDYNGGPRAVRYYQAGWKLGPAVHYANVVWALRGAYRAHERGIDAVLRDGG